MKVLRSGGHRETNHGINPDTEFSNKINISQNLKMFNL